VCVCVCVCVYLCVPSVELVCCLVQSCFACVLVSVYGRERWRMLSRAELFRVCFGECIWEREMESVLSRAELFRVCFGECIWEREMENTHAYTGKVIPTHTHTHIRAVCGVTLQ